MLFNFFETCLWGCFLNYSAIEFCLSCVSAFDIIKCFLIWLQRKKREAFCLTWRPVMFVQTFSSWGWMVCLLWMYFISDVSGLLDVCSIRDIFWSSSKWGSKLMLHLGKYHCNSCAVLSFKVINGFTHVKRQQWGF